jgi:hypothetical protein
MSISNQFGQIRGHYLVGSKAQSQFEPALENISTSLTRYGHGQPQTMFTDNLDNTPLLTRRFPSLIEGVVPVNKYARLPKFTIPDDVTVITISTTDQINRAVASILGDLKDDPNHKLAVSLDCEWNVDIGSHTAASTALLQVAYAQRIYVMQVRW